MAKIKLEESNVKERNLREIKIEDIIYSIVLKEVSSIDENKKVS